MLQTTNPRRATGINSQQQETVLQKVNFNGKPAAELIQVRRLNYDGTPNVFLMFRTPTKTAKGVFFESISSSEADKIRGLFNRKLKKLQQLAKTERRTGETVFLRS